MSNLDNLVMSKIASARPLNLTTNKLGLNFKINDLLSDTNIPSFGIKANELFEQIRDYVVSGSVEVTNPNYLGHMTGPLADIAPELEGIIAQINQNLVKVETATTATFLEIQTLIWFHKLIYDLPGDEYSEAFLNRKFICGKFVSGGTLGNLFAMQVALNRAFPMIDKEGLADSLNNSNYNGVAILVSDRAHYSISKSAGILGIGSNSVIKVSVDPYTNQINLAELERVVSELKSRNIKIIALIGIAGTTETGSIDDLKSMALVARNNEIWFHVDAAWGGQLLFSQSGSELLEGLNEADSVVIDAHKGMYVSLTCGMVFFKDPFLVNNLNYFANYIIRQNSFDLGRTGIEGSRRFDSLKVWATIKYLGFGGLTALVDSVLERANSFQRIIQERKDFELTSQPSAGIITYRYKPACSNSLNLDRENLNLINIKIQERLANEAGYFVSRTVLNSVKSQLDYTTVVLRAVMLNPYLTTEMMTDLLEQQAKLGESIIKELNGQSSTKTEELQF